MQHDQWIRFGNQADHLAQQLRLWAFPLAGTQHERATQSADRWEELATEARLIANISSPAVRGREGRHWRRAAGVELLKSSTGGAPAVAAILGFRVLSSVPTLAAVETAILSILAVPYDEQIDETVMDVYERLQAGDPETVASVQPVRLFAEHLTAGDVVPVERSPLQKTSLMALLGASGMAIKGEAILSTWASHPALVITVPVGIVLTGVALGYAQGLHHTILKKFCGLRDQADESNDQND